MGKFTKDLRQKYLETMLQEESLSDSTSQFMVAICAVKLEEYEKARRMFRAALDVFLWGERKFWFDTSQPNWLADTYMMAGAPSCTYDQAYQQIEAYKLDPRGASPVALYSYGLLRLANGRAADALKYASDLLAKPKIKYTHTAGQAIRAIVERNQSAFDSALDALLLAHRGMAKFGGLRETPEGYLCLPAMSLAGIALGRGMTVTAESEYLSLGYLDYLMSTATSGIGEPPRDVRG